MSYDELDFDYQQALAERRPLTDSEAIEARRVIARQASTAPGDGNIGPAGAWDRAEGVQVLGRKAHDRLDGPSGLPSLPARPGRRA